MLSPSALTGAYTAIVTPFTPDGASVDVPALEALVDWQIASGVAGLVACGTTGESPTLSEAEFSLVVERTVAVARHRVPVLAGTGAFSTAKTISLTSTAAKAGVDGVMVVMPYYNRPSQKGLVEHVCKVAAAAAQTPIVLYNIPVRTGVDLGVDATAEICERAPNVIGIKDATGNVLRCQQLMRRLGDRLVVMSGDDALTVGMMACGARGLISTTSNLLPAQVSETCKLALAGKWDEARKAHLRLLPVYETMFAEPSPAPVKAALSMRGRMSDAVRPPLDKASEALRATIQKVLSRFEADA